MLTAKTFQVVMAAATEADPYGKRLSKETIGLLYMTLPDAVKQETTDEMFLFAFKQHQLNPSHEKDLALHMQLFKHVYRVENETPNFSWGLKADLNQRMLKPSVFHGQALSDYESGADLHQLPEGGDALGLVA